MPDWCLTTIKFTGNITDITNLHDRIEEYTSKNFIENGFGETWLGNIVIGFEIGKPEDVDKEIWPRCRGSITNIGDVSNIDGDDCANFYIDTETAWCPMFAMWVEIIKKYYSDEKGEPKIAITYIALEPGNELYSTNDFDEWGDMSYHYEFMDDEHNIYEFDEVGSEERLIEVMNKLLEPLNVTVSSLDELNKFIDDNENDDLNIVIIKLEYHDINEYK